MSPADRFDKLMKSVRLCGMIVGLVVMALGIYLFASLASLNPRNSVNAIYQIIFGALIIISEFRWVRLLKYFYFLQHFLGLGLFYIYVGFLCLGGTWYQYAVAGVCLGVGLVYFILGLGCRKMGRENFRRSGVEPPATAAEGTPSAPPAAGGGVKTAAAAPSGTTAYGNAYGGGDGTTYGEPEAIRAARTNASAYTADAYSNDAPPPAYGSEPHSAYSNDAEQV